MGIDVYLLATKRLLLSAYGTADQELNLSVTQSLGVDGSHTVVRDITVRLGYWRGNINTYHWACENCYDDGEHEHAIGRDSIGKLIPVVAEQWVITNTDLLAYTLQSLNNAMALDYTWRLHVEMSR